MYFPKAQNTGYLYIDLKSLDRKGVQTNTLWMESRWATEGVGQFGFRLLPELPIQI